MDRAILSGAVVAEIENQLHCSYMVNQVILVILVK